MIIGSGFKNNYCRRKMAKVFLIEQIKPSLDAQGKTYELKLLSLFEDSFQQEHVCIETTQLLYALNQLIGFYIALAEQKFPTRFYLSRDCYKIVILAVYFNSFYYAFTCFLNFYIFIFFLVFKLVIKELFHSVDGFWKVKPKYQLYLINFTIALIFFHDVEASCYFIYNGLKTFCERS